MLHRSSRQHGFTLLELSIVIVIIGLIVGGLVAVRQLSRTAERDRLVSDFQALSQAHKFFKDKYNQYAGDMYNAEDFWGTDPDGCSGASANTPKIETCNGDGDGAMTVAPATDETAERFRYYQHLSNANLLHRQFTGTTGPNAPGEFIPGVNCEGTIRGVCLGIGWNNVSVTNPDNFPHPAGFFLEFGLGTVENGETHHRVLTPVEAFLIDQKIDDGKPGYGEIQGHPPTAAYNANCVTTSDETTAAYEDNDDTQECGLMFYLPK